METIIASCITGAVTLVVCLLTYRTQSAKTQAIIEYKLETLTQEVRKHNSLVERVYKLEKDSAIHTEQIHVINHRLADIEKGAEDLHG